MDCSPLGSSLSMGFPRQEYWSGLLFAPLEDLPNLEIKSVAPESPTLVGGFFYCWEILAECRLGLTNNSTWPLGSQHHSTSPYQEDLLGNIQWFQQEWVLECHSSSIMKILAEFTWKENLCSQYDKKELLLLLPFPSFFFPPMSQQQSSFPVRKKIFFFQLIQSCLDHQKGKPLLAHPPNSKTLLPSGFVSEATFTKILVTGPTSKQGAGTWNILRSSSSDFWHFKKK